MRRKYVDLHLSPDLNTDTKVELMIRKANEFGYSLIAASLPKDVGTEKIRRLQDICKENQIGFVSRVDLRPKTSEELIRSLRKLRRKFEIIAVMCDSKNIARKAAKDHRVDLINFPSFNSRRRFFDKSEAELMTGASVSFEIDMEPLLTLEGTRRIRLLSSLRRETAIAEKFYISIVISSGASDEFLMRKPLEMTALASLFDLDRNLAAEAISRNPMEIVKRNREKFDPKFVAPGIRLIRKGEDC